MRLILEKVFQSGQFSFSQIQLLIEKYGIKRMSHDEIQTTIRLIRPFLKENHPDNKAAVTLYKKIHAAHPIPLKTLLSLGTQTAIQLFIQLPNAVDMLTEIAQQTEFTKEVEVFLDALGKQCSESTDPDSLAFIKTVFTSKKFNQALVKLISTTSTNTYKTDSTKRLLKIVFSGSLVTAPPARFYLQEKARLNSVITDKIISLLFNSSLQKLSDAFPLVNTFTDKIYVDCISYFSSATIKLPSDATLREEPVTIHEFLGCQTLYTEPISVEKFKEFILHNSSKLKSYDESFPELLCRLNIKSEEITPELINIIIKFLENDFNSCTRILKVVEEKVQKNECCLKQTALDSISRALYTTAIWTGQKDAVPEDKLIGIKFTELLASMPENDSVFQDIYVDDITKIVNHFYCDSDAQDIVFMDGDAPVLSARKLSILCQLINKRLPHPSMNKAGQFVHTLVSERKETLLSAIESHLQAHFSGEKRLDPEVASILRDAYTQIVIFTLNSEEISQENKDKIVKKFDQFCDKMEAAFSQHSPPLLYFYEHPRYLSELINSLQKMTDKLPIRIIQLFSAPEHTSPSASPPKALTLSKKSLDALLKDSMWEMEGPVLPTPLIAKAIVQTFGAILRMIEMGQTTNPKLLDAITHILDSTVTMLLPPSSKADDENIDSDLYDYMSELVTQLSTAYAEETDLEKSKQLRDYLNRIQTKTAQLLLHTKIGPISGRTIFRVTRKAAKALQAKARTETIADVKTYDDFTENPMPLKRAVSMDVWTTFFSQSDDSLPIRHQLIILLCKTQKIDDTFKPKLINVFKQLSADERNEILKNVSDAIKQGITAIDTELFEDLKHSITET